MCLGPTSGTAEEDSELPRHTFLSAPLAQVFTSVQIVLCKIQIFSSFRKSIFCKSVVVFYFHLSAPRIRLPPLQTDRNLYFLQTCVLFFVSIAAVNTSSLRGQNIRQSPSVYSNTVCSDPILSPRLLLHPSPCLPLHSEERGNKGDRLPAACRSQSERRFPALI